MDQISDAKISIVHFAHPDFRRCAKMSRELSVCLVLVVSAHTFIG
jgi:hypothetical protein